MKAPNDCKTRRNDLFLVLFFLLIGAVLALALFSGRKSGKQVLVKVSGETVAVYPLDEDGEWLIETASGGTNHLVIQDGRVWLDEASCPDGLCVKQGKIQYSNESIICLPNEVVIEVSGVDELGLDGVAG